MEGNLNVDINLHGTITVDGTLNGTITAGGGGGGGVIADENITVSASMAGNVMYPTDGHAFYEVNAATLQNKTVTPTAQQQVITCDDYDNYLGLGVVTVGAVNLQNKTVTPTAQQQVITADSGYNGLGTVTVGAASGGDDLGVFFTQNHTQKTIATAAGATFLGMINVTNLTITGATTIGGFGYNKNIESLSLPDATKLNFEACRDMVWLTSVDAPKVAIVGDYAFANSWRLATITLPSAVKIGANAFSGCDALTTVRLPNMGVGVVDPENPYSDTTGKIADGVFSNANALTDIWFGYNEDDGVTYPPTITSLTFSQSPSTKIKIHVYGNDALDYFRNDTIWNAAEDANAIEFVVETIPS